MALAVMVSPAAALNEEVSPGEDAVLPESVEAAPVESESWTTRVQRLRDEMVTGERNEEDANDVYLELSELLHRRRDRLRQALTKVRSTSAPVQVPVGQGRNATHAATPGDLYDNLVGLYQVRSELLDLVSPELRAEITGTGRYGMQEAGAELDYVLLTVRFQALDAESYLDLMDRARRAPFPFLRALVLMCLLVLVFRWWRGWLPETLRRARAALMEVRPRSAAVLLRLKALWYVDQVRSPIEWLLLGIGLSAVFDIEGLRFEERLLGALLGWVLMGWLAVSVINAVSARGHAGLTGATAAIRLRTYRLVAAWLVSLGLGLELTLGFAGTGTLYSWVWRLSTVLAVPVLALTIVWWRPAIFRQLELETDRTAALQRKLRHRTGLRGFVNAASGAMYLAASGLRRYLLRNVRRVGPGQLVAGGPLEPPAEAGESSRPISEASRDLIVGDQSADPRPVRAQLQALLQLARAGRAGVVGVVAERGGGKSAFLRLLASELGSAALTVQCGFEGSDELLSRLGGALGLDAAPATPDELSERLARAGIRVVALDDIHRMVRLVIGGHAELERFSSFAESVAGPLLWVLTVDRFALQVILRARPRPGMLDELIELPRWTPEQIGELLGRRSAEAGLTPDFESLVVPREYLETSLETEEQRNRASVYNIIADLSAGNPAVALLRWADCLRLDAADDHAVIRLPTEPDERELESASIQRLLVLRLIAHAETIAAEDIAESLGYPVREVRGILYAAAARGWVERVDDRYRLSWNWFRPVSRVLARRNMLVSSLGEIVS